MVIEEIESGKREERQGRYDYISYVAYRGSNGSARVDNQSNTMEFFVASGEERKIYLSARKIDKRFFYVYKNKDKENNLFVVGDFDYWNGIKFSRGFCHLESLEDPKSVILSSLLLTIADSEKYSSYKGEITDWELGEYLRDTEARRKNEIQKSHVRPKRNAFSIYNFYRKGIEINANL